MYLKVGTDLKVDRGHNQVDNREVNLKVEHAHKVDKIPLEVSPKTTSLRGVAIKEVLKEESHREGNQVVILADNPVAKVEVHKVETNQVINLVLKTNLMTKPQQVRNNKQLFDSHFQK